MNLVIDLGNTRIKAALFTGHELTQLKIYSTIDGLNEDASLTSDIKKCIVGSVTGDHDLIKLSTGITPLIFNSTTRIPVKNNYKSASTLGSDRLAAAIGAYSIYPGKNVLCIDAGTCIKYNFTNANAEYLGGAIAPGLQMRAKAMHEYTHRLPLVKPDDDFHQLIGTTTEESLLSGVINGVISETDGLISDYKKNYPDLVVAFTGGDTDFFVKRLKNSIFAHPNLVLTGLNEILIYNS